MKNQTLFKQLFFSIAACVVGVMIAFSAVVATLSYNYSIDQKNEMLGRDAERIASFMQILADNYTPALEQTVLHNLQQAMFTSDATMLIYSASGALSYYAGGVPVNQAATLPSEIVSTLQQTGSFSGISTLGNIYDHMVYIVGRPIYNSSGVFSGAVILSTETPYVKDFVQELFAIMLDSLIAVLALSLILSYFISRRLTRPIHQMNAAAKEYAKGNFAPRISTIPNGEIGELASTFNNMASSLQQLDTMRNNFLANVSHDLKTPMTVIGGFVDGILDGAIPEEKREKYLHIVSDEIKRLSRMVKGILDLARLEGDGYQINRTIFDMNDLVGSVLIGLEVPIREKNIYVETHFQSDRTAVDADRDMIFQVVYNLLDNAVKFVNENGVISVVLETKDNKVYCTIKNTGKGLTREEAEHIFDRFYKTDESRGKDKRGVGLGLPIVRSILIAHKENIEVQSVPGESCSFTFSLPPAPEALPAEHTQIK